MSRSSLLPSLLLLSIACSADPSDDDASSVCAGAKCDALDQDQDDDVPAAACDGVMIDKSGRGLQSGKIAGGLGDALARHVFTPGDDCPATYPEVIAKLEASGACDDKRTMLVSETAQLVGKPTTYRAVIVLHCDVDGESSSTWFSLFGIDGQVADFPGDVEIPTSAEMIAFDPVAGHFDYFETNGEGGIDFFGTSRDFLDGPGEGDEQRCAQCHTGGSLIMKELDSPWMHWEGTFPTPGAKALIEDDPDLLGKRSDGVILENIINERNREWNEARIAGIVEDLGPGGTTAQDLLLPLFCTVEVNLASQSGATAMGGKLGGAVIDRTFSVFASIDASAEQYLAILANNDQRLDGTDAKDTIGALANVTRGNADLDYQRRLVDAGVVDEELVEDVLLVDFTRSIFSDDRCRLLDFAPNIDAESATARTIRDGFIANLEKVAAQPGTPEGDLLRNLDNDGDDAEATAKRFTDTCRARSESRTLANGQEVLAVFDDYLQVVSHNRRQAAALPLFEFPETMPTDALSTPPGLRLDPNTCELTSEYVSIVPVDA